MPSEIVNDLLSKAKQQLIDGDFDAAARSAKGVLALDDTNSEAVEVVKAAEAAVKPKLEEAGAVVEVSKGAPPLQESNDRNNVSHSVSGESDEESDSKPKKNKRGRKFAWLLLFIVIVIWFASQNSESGDDARSSDQPETGGTTSQSAAPVSAPVYEGCDGLEDLIPKLKSVGGSSLSLYQAVNAGSDAACNRIIEGWNKPENLKD